MASKKDVQSWDTRVAKPRSGRERDDRPRLCDLIRHRTPDIVDAWARRVRTLPPARALPRPVLIDDLHDVLARIADAVESDQCALPGARADAPRAHAIDRLSRGFELDEVIKEYSLLRECILDLWETEAGSSIELSELRRLDRAVDQSMIGATIRYAQARERILMALDRISDAALSSGDLDEFLPRLLRATLETMEASDVAAIYLKEGDQLRIRAAIGREEDLANGFSMKVGEGFAGTIAAEGEPRFTSAADADPLVKSETLRARHVKALYGVPLLHAGQVIGVANTGSISADEFSEDDKLLLRTMANRATAVIIQAQLIGARRRAEAELRESEARFRAVADNIPQLAWMADERGTVLWRNRRWEDFAGTRRDHVAAWGVRLLHPDHVDRVMDRFRQHIETGEAWQDTVPLLGTDGRYRWFLARAVPVRDEHGRLVRWFGTNTDVNDEHLLKEASALLSSSLDLPETLASIARVVVPGLADWCTVEIITDGGTTKHLAVEHTDPARAELARDLIARFPRDPDQPHGVPHALRTGRPVLYEEVSDELLTAVATTPEHLAILRGLGLSSAMVVPMIARGRSVGAISFITAESDRRYTSRDLDLAEELASRAALALDNARLFREARAAVRARQDLLAVVSHDLRNPLMTVNMATELLLQRAIAAGSSSRKQLEMILRSAARMQHLIGDLLDVAGIQTGRFTVDRRDERGEAILVEAVELNEALAAERGLEIERRSRLGDVRICCDRDRIIQVFSNLFGNAVKFGRRGDRITVGAAVEDGAAHFSVRDTGPGISPEQLPHIFEPYWSADPNTKGTGLGLFIAKGIVEAHGGRIWAESTTGADATFHFTLPIVRSSD